jgi:hypothetical protein
MVPADAQHSAHASARKRLLRSNSGLFIEFQEIAKAAGKIREQLCARQVNSGQPKPARNDAVALARKIRFLSHEPLCSQNSNAALEAPVAGQNGPLHPDCDRANQYVRRSALHTAAAAEIIEACGLLVMESREWFIRERLKCESQFLKLNPIFNAGEDLLADRANDGDAAILDCLDQRCEHQLLVAAHYNSLPAPH